MINYFIAISFIAALKINKFQKTLFLKNNLNAQSFLNSEIAMTSLTSLMNRKWTLAERPTDKPIGNYLFRWTKEPLRDLKEGEFLVKNLCFFFDPSQRLWMQRDTYLPKLEIGATMQSAGVGTVIQSRNPNFVTGPKVSGLFGCRIMRYAANMIPAPFLCSLQKCLMTLL